VRERGREGQRERGREGEKERGTEGERERRREGERKRGREEEGVRDSAAINLHTLQPHCNTHCSMLYKPWSMHMSAHARDSLQHTVTHCNYSTHTLQHTATTAHTLCNTLHLKHVATRCNEQCFYTPSNSHISARARDPLHHTATHCNYNTL